MTATVVADRTRDHNAFAVPCSRAGQPPSSATTYSSRQTLAFVLNGKVLVRARHAAWARRQGLPRRIVLAPTQVVRPLIAGLPPMRVDEQITPSMRRLGVPGEASRSCHRPGRRGRHEGRSAFTPRAPGEAPGAVGPRGDDRLPHRADAPAAGARAARSRLRDRDGRRTGQHGVTGELVGSSFRDPHRCVGGWRSCSGRPRRFAEHEICRASSSGTGITRWARTRQRVHSRCRHRSAAPSPPRTPPRGSPAA
jgi:hypothetical protein